MILLLSFMILFPYFSCNGPITMPIIMSHKNVLTVTNYIPQQGPSFTPQIKLESYSNHKTIIIH